MASNGTEDGIIEIDYIKDGSQNISGRWNSETLQLINGTNLSVAGTLDVTGTTTLGVVTSVTSIQATTYYGDGSKLTGISAGKVVLKMFHQTPPFQELSCSIRSVLSTNTHNIRKRCIDCNSRRIDL